MSFREIDEAKKTAAALATTGRRMAQMVAGKGQGLDLPIFTSQLPSHGVLTPFRRLGQRFMYVWYYLKDEKF